MTNAENINRINATFTHETFTVSTFAIISTIDAEDTFTEIARILVADLGALAPADHDQDDVMAGLNDAVDGLAAARGLRVTGSDGDSGNFFWTVSA